MSDNPQAPDLIARLRAGDAEAAAEFVRHYEPVIRSRIRVWLRHTQRAAADSLSSVLDVGPLQIDFDRRLAFVSGREVRLTPTQYKLFATLMRNAGKVMTHEQILFGVWGPAYTRETQYLRVYMGQLRQKFEEEPARPRYFLTEPGVGYRLRAS